MTNILIKDTQRLKQEAFEIETSLNLNNKTKRDTQEYLIGAV
jgi:hypothetical protein